MSFGYGTYLTSQTRPGMVLQPSEAIIHTHINGGLVYTEDGDVVQESIDNRFSSVPMDMTLPIDDRSDDTFLFLGLTVTINRP